MKKAMESEITMAKRMMQPLEIAKAKGIVPTTIACADGGDGDVDVDLSSTTGAMAARSEQDGDRITSSLPSSQAVTGTRRHGSDDNHANKNTNSMTMPDSPRSFDSNELFDDVLDETNEGRMGSRITDDDLERLMGTNNFLFDENDPDHSQRHQRNKNNNSIDFAGQSCIMQQYYRVRSWMCCPRCCNGPRRSQQRRINNIGNMIILFPYYCVAKFNCGIIGPHWFGPVACLVLLSASTSYLVSRSYRTVGPITAQTCLGFYAISVLLLSIVACRDPGVVRSSTIATQDDEREGQRMMDHIMTADEGEGESADGIAGRNTLGAGRGRELSGRGSGRATYVNANRRTGIETDGWRYCDLCSVYQPPGAVHCPDCNVCIKGFDHHCPWMGTCIGEKNYTPFLAFNLTWLVYLFYAIVWVLNIGAQLYHARAQHHDASSLFTPNDDET